MPGALANAAALEIELQEVRFNEHVAVCGVASGDKLWRDYKNSGLQIKYCGSFILFEREGYCDEAVNFSLVKGMKALKDWQEIEENKGNYEAKKKAAEAAKVVALQVEREAKKAEALAKEEAEVAAKMANPNFANSRPPVEVKEMLSDMRAEKGVMGDEEERSMRAAVARAKRKK
mgnify:CR=1 FL=1